MRTQNFVLVLVFCLCACRAELSVDPVTSFLTDQAGRFRFFHGVNAVYKQFPYLPTTQAFSPETSLAEADFAKLSSWGFNAIRLYVAWQGFQPREKQYNYTYLEALRQIVRRAGQHGIWVLLDAHQDLYSRRFCGQGLPDWLVRRSTFPAPLKVKLSFDQNGNPTKQSCKQISFQKYYATEDVMRYSHDFFTNKNEMADKFTQMWVNVVAYFKAQPNLMGYDLINQPSGANAGRNPYDLYGPGVNNNKYLLPFYKKLAQAIRQIDSEKLIFFQPSVQDYLGGFLGSPSGPELAHKDVLSYHVYCPFRNQANQPTSVAKCKVLDFMQVQNRVSNAKRLKVGSVITELGSVGESQPGLEQVSRVLASADRNWQSWFWWQYKRYADFTTLADPWAQSFFHPDGSEQTKKIFTLSYPYAYAVCGSPIQQTHSLGTYTLTWVPAKCGDSPTEIFINEELYFSAGFTASFSPHCKECQLVNYRRNYYQVLVPDRLLHSKLQLRIAGYV